MLYLIFKIPTLLFVLAQTNRFTIKRWAVESVSFLGCHASWQTVRCASSLVKNVAQAEMSLRKDLKEEQEE